MLFSEKSEAIPLHQPIALACVQFHKAQPASLTFYPPFPFELTTEQRYKRLKSAYRRRLCYEKKRYFSCPHALSAYADGGRLKALQCKTVITARAIRRLPIAGAVLQVAVCTLEREGG